jgi:hypothetical protein
MSADSPDGLELPTPANIGSLNTVIGQSTAQTTTAGTTGGIQTLALAFSQGALGGTGVTVTGVTVSDVSGAVWLQETYTPGVAAPPVLMVPVIARPGIEYDVTVTLSANAPVAVQLATLYEIDVPLGVLASNTPQQPMWVTSAASAPEYTRETPPGTVSGASGAGTGTNVGLLSIPPNRVWKGSVWLTAIAGAGAGFAYLSVSGATVSPPSATRLAQLDLSGNNSMSVSVANVYVAAGANTATLVYTTSGSVTAVDVGCCGILL